MMIRYTPLWKTMKNKGFTTYTLRVKHKISSSTVQRLRKNMSFQLIRWMTYANCWNVRCLILQSI